MRFAKWGIMLLALEAFPASAAERTVGGVKINLVAPSGQCELTGATPKEAEVVKKMRELMQAGQGTLLAIYADCDQLTAFRKNLGELQDFSQYIVQNGLIDRILPARVVSDVCEVKRKMPATTLEDITKLAQSRIKESGLNFTVEQAHYLGVLAEDKDACYGGNVQAAAGKLLVNIATSVLVKGKFITYQIYTPYRGKHSVDELLKRHKANVAAFRAANAQ